MKTRCFLSALIFLLVAFDLLADNQKRTIKIGVIIPLTGGAAARGQDIVPLLDIMQKRFNSNSEKFNYHFILEDGKCGAGNSATTAAMKLINIDKVKFMILGCSGETLQAAAIAEKNKVIAISVGALHPDVKNLGDYIFRTFIDSEKSFLAFADFMYQDADGKIALITEENAFTSGIKKLFTDQLRTSIIIAEDFTSETTDFNSLIAKIKHKNPKGIFLNTVSESMLATLVNQLRQRGMNQKLYSFIQAEEPSFIAATGKNSRDMFFIGTPDLPYHSEGFDQMMQDYRLLDPDGPNYDFMVRVSYDALNAIFDGIEQAGDDTAAVKDFLYKYSRQGALGKVEFDSNGDIKNLNYVIRKMGADGRHTVVRPLVPVN